MLSFNTSKFEKQITSLQEVISNKDIIIDNLKKECLVYKKTISAYPDVKAEYDEKVNDLNKQFQSKLKKLELEKETVKNSVATKINFELASIGIPIEKAPTIKDNSGVENNPMEVLATLNSLKGFARTEYYRKNESVLLRTLQQLSNNKQ